MCLPFYFFTILSLISELPSGTNLFLFEAHPLEIILLRENLWGVNPFSFSLSENDFIYLH